MAFDPKIDFANLSQRLSELAARLDESARGQGVDKAAARGIKVLESAFIDLRKLEGQRSNNVSAASPRLRCSDRVRLSW